MISNKSVLVLCVATALLAACKPKATEAPAPQATPAPTAEAPAVPAPATQAAAATPAATEFDIGKFPVSDKPLPAWPYVALPVGYHFSRAEDMAGQSKDLARVAVWTGGQLLWVEGKAFSDSIRSDDGKTYSKFELRKNVQQAVEALGGVRLGERSYDEATYKANEKALDDFRQEFDRMAAAYGYDADADTYLIRRSDKVVWVVFQSDNFSGALMVAEGPLPGAPAK